MDIKITVKALILRYYELMEHAYHLPTNIIEIREDEGSWNVEATSYNVFSILAGKSFALFHG